MGLGLCLMMAEHYRRRLSSWQQDVILHGHLFSTVCAINIYIARKSAEQPYHLLSDVTLHELGLSRHPPLPLTTEASAWNYKSMADPPPAQPPARQQAASMYKAVVPAKNIESRDFAVNGSVFTTNNAYAWEVAAHWISSYFLEDPFLVVPSAQEAEQRAELMGAWLRKRYPDALVWANESHSSDIAFWTSVPLLSLMDLYTLKHA